jgi:integrase/recombinase XerD
MTATNDLFEQFLQHGSYLRDWSPQTVTAYRQSLRYLPAQITKASLNTAVVAMRERGLTPGGINLRVRSINSFLTWLHEEGHLSERLRIKLLKNPPKPIQVLNDQEIKRLVTFKPKGRVEARRWTLAVLLLDCGLRIGEALGLERAKVDLDGLALRVLGKGNKERFVPISPELRKHLFRLLNQRSSARTGRWVFQNFEGDQLTRNHAYRDLQKLAKAIGIKTKVHPHAFRHCFAASYVRRGGDIYRLSRILGHTSINTTQIYLRSMGIEHLREGHEKFSPLGLS